MKTVCIFLGSTLGSNDIYKNAIEQLGKELAIRGIHLVYGGGRKGLMGILADTVIKNGGTVTGVITRSLYEIEGHDGLTELHIVETMQERKFLMSRLSDGFIVFPGGLGTLEELFEVWNAAKINLHNKAIGILNINNFYDGLMDFINHTIQEGFATDKHQKVVLTSDDPSCLLDMLNNNNSNNVKINSNKSFLTSFGR
jgi:uncharacterized protein (TIGR00730 family)